VLVELLLLEFPQPAKANRHRKPNIHNLQRAPPNHRRGSGDTRARTSPEGATKPRLLLVALTVIVVLCAVLPETVAGEKLQPQPLGKPVQANESEALNPFTGVTETFSEPDAPCVTDKVLLERVKP
jgi:hypothetical protein